MKNSMLTKRLIFGILLFIGLSNLLSIITADGHQNEVTIENESGIYTEKIMNAAYTGRLRVYIIEPVSRWKNYNGDAYHFGFLDFAFNENISIDIQNSFHKSLTWRGDIDESNAMVIAAVFNSEAYQAYSNFPLGSFWAHYTDATAAATPGKIGYNTVTTNFTHTVFVEEATGTWCHNCPAIANALNNIYTSGDYPWYYVAMIEDKNSLAKSYLENDYNIVAYPALFFDGGNKVFVGVAGPDYNENESRSRIEACGKRVVPSLNLSISVTYIGNGDLQIEVDITKVKNLPPNIPTITGKTNGTIRTSYDYSIQTTDVDQDKVKYYIDWGDSTTTITGLNESGEEIKISHRWNINGTYIIKVKAIDEYSAESDWATLPVTMPYSSKLIFKSLEWLFQWFPNAFPILRQ